MVASPSGPIAGEAEFWSGVAYAQRFFIRSEHGAFLPLEILIELKLASGLSAPHRLKDLADVLELVRSANLPESLAARLDPSVRAKYTELWSAAQTRDEE
ncbi:MAG TPA: hypothetical protein VF469_10775 [Kofleriaceae bacterium]